MSRCLKLCTACVGRTCDGNFEIVDGMSVSTPYCQDENLAVQQRRRGSEVSGSEIRHHAPNSSAKPIVIALYWFHYVLLVSVNYFGAPTNNAPVNLPSPPMSGA